MNVDASTLTPGSFARRLTDTLPEVACTHGRGVTVTASGAAERFAIV